MNTRIAILVAVCCAVGIGCTNASSRSEPSPPAVPSADCNGQFSPSQFVGTWQEADSPGIRTLNADGTMTSGTGDETATGAWEFTKWSNTPQPVRPGDENDCVLWLKPSPVLNLVYGVLSVTAQSITLTYIGRGNTIVWNRSDSM